MMRRRLPEALALAAAAAAHGAAAYATEGLLPLGGDGDGDARGLSPVRRRLDGGSSSEGYNFMFYFVIGAMMLTCLIYNIFFKRKMEAGFLRQQAMPETMLRQDVIASDQEMSRLWECEVCCFKSYEAHQTCMLCGTDRCRMLLPRPPSWLSSDTNDVCVFPR
jgi:hypothetical protein